MNEYTNPLKILCHANDLINNNLVCCEVNPTNLCTQDCEWCLYRGYRKKNPVSMPKETMLELLADLKQMNCESVIFSGGGEPLCHPNIEEALWFAKALGLKVGLITNGDLLSEQMNDTILYACDWVKVSVNSINEDPVKIIHLKDLIKRRSKTVVSISAFDEGIIKALKEEGLKPDFFTHSKIRDRFDRVDCSKCYVTQSYTTIGPDCEAYLCCSHMGNKKMSYGNVKRKPLSQLWRSKNRQKVIKTQRKCPPKCPPCRFDSQNSIINYLLGEKPHKEFI